MGIKTKSKFSNSKTILLDLKRNDKIFKGICEQANLYNWRVVDLSITRRKYIPVGDPIGLLTDKFLNDPLSCSLRKQGCYILRLGSQPRPEEDNIVPVILPDRNAIGKIAAEHFAERNFIDVGYIGNYPWSEPPVIYRSFKKRSMELGCKSHLLQIKSLPHYKDSEKKYQYRMKQISDWLKKVPKPIGILTYSDYIASFISMLAHLNKIVIPDQVALLGMGNDSLTCDLLSVPLSSIDPNLEEIGKQAVETIYNLTLGKTIQEIPILIPPKEIVERQSTNLLAVDNPLVAKVLRYIWENLELQLSIDDIARQFGVSRSILDHSFKHCLGRSPSAERHRKRLERCADLLRTSNLTIPEIAESVGFPSVSYLHRSFKKRFGTTPRKFRI